MNKKIGLILLIIFVITITGVSCNRTTETPDGTRPPGVNEGIEIGNLAPDFQLKNLDGEVISLSDYRGRPVIINFWATWCSYCLLEMPYLEQIYEDWTGQGLIMLAVDKGESKSRVEAFLQTRPISLLILLDTDESVSRKYRAFGIPTTYFIDKDGIIQEKVVGAFPSVLEIEKRLIKIMP